ncbi:MAG TPA: C40 family peptidase [Streptosporangiaceae bacterium]
MTGAAGGASLGKGAVIAVVSAAGLLLAGLLVAPMMLFASSGLSFESGNACSAASGQGTQPVASTGAKNSIPANYLTLFKSTGARYGVPWVILAGIAKVESDDGRSSLPGVHSGSNAFGAAGPMQIGIGGASGNTWGGTAIHPASEKVSGVATDGNGDGIASVYDPADAIAGAAKYLLEHGVLDNVQGAIFAYNHLESYVQTVLLYAGGYANGGYSVSPVTLDAAPSCLTGVTNTPNAVVATVIAYAEGQLGKPYLWGGTGPDAFDCSGLVMMAYRAAGIDLLRTSQAQWTSETHIRASQAQPGDLVFFAGSDGTTASPGHVGLVIGGGKMIEAYATGFPIRVAPYGGRGAVGFTRPWLHHSVALTAATQLGG